MQIFSVMLISFGFVVSVNLQMIRNGVTCEDKKVIIDFHNELRKLVANGKLENQPKSANMQKLIWDDELETKAQNWANNMKFQHNPDRKIGRYSTGENIYIFYTSGSDTGFDWKQPIQSWFDEHKDYSYKPTENDPKTGHYTQLIWADTVNVGCGASHYIGDKEMKYSLYVCDYGPAGNYLGEYPYAKGEGCEDLCCKSDCDVKYGSQC